MPSFYLMLSLHASSKPLYITVICLLRSSFWQKKIIIKKYQINDEWMNVSQTQNFLFISMDIVQYSIIPIFSSSLPSFISFYYLLCFLLIYLWEKFPIHLNHKEMLFISFCLWILICSWFINTLESMMRKNHSFHRQDVKYCYYLFLKEYGTLFYLFILWKWKKDAERIK